jgi:hypothetical protein
LPLALLAVFAATKTRASRTEFVRWPVKTSLIFDIPKRPPPKALHFFLPFAVPMRPPFAPYKEAKGRRPIGPALRSFCFERGCVRVYIAIITFTTLIDRFTSQRLQAPFGL